MCRCSQNTILGMVLDGIQVGLYIIVTDIVDMVDMVGTVDTVDMDMVGTVDTVDMDMEDIVDTVMDIAATVAGTRDSKLRKNKKDRKSSRGFL